MCRVRALGWYVYHINICVISQRGSTRDGSFDLIKCVFIFGAGTIRTALGKCVAHLSFLPAGAQALRVGGIYVCASRRRTRDI